MTVSGHVSNDGLATVRQAAEYLSVCRDTVYRLMNEGVLESTHIGRARRISWASIKQLQATGHGPRAANA